MPRPFPYPTHRAKSLRVNQTEMEKRLWRHLRDRRKFGTKFRRQAPIGPYIVDFVSFDLKIIVELDGGQHSIQKDAPRTAFLEQEGFEVIRFWNNEIAENIDGVLLRIRTTVDMKRRQDPPSLDGRELEGG